MRLQPSHKQTLRTQKNTLKTRWTQEEKEKISQETSTLSTDKHSDPKEKGTKRPNNEQTLNEQNKHKLKH